MPWGLSLKVASASSAAVLLGGRAQGGLADRLGLKEAPQVGGIDMARQRIGLRTLAAHFRDRQQGGENGHQQSDFLV
jgi:hypothetical protein